MKNCHQSFAFSKTSKQKSTKTIGHLFFIGLWAKLADKAVFYYNNVLSLLSQGRVLKRKIQEVLPLQSIWYGILYC